MTLGLRSASGYFRRTSVVALAVFTHHTESAQLHEGLQTFRWCAGGRNMTLGLRSASGYFRRTSVVALAVFTHHWYWFALSYFLSLALKPTVLIGLTPRMVLPKMQVCPLLWLGAVASCQLLLLEPTCCNPSMQVAGAALASIAPCSTGLREQHSGHSARAYALAEYVPVHAQVQAKCKPSLFAYPAPVTEEATTAVSRLPTAVLSTTAKAKERAQRRQARTHPKHCRLSSARFMSVKSALLLHVQTSTLG